MEEKRNQKFLYAVQGNGCDSENGKEAKERKIEETNEALTRLPTREEVSNTIGKLQNHKATRDYNEIY